MSASSGSPTATNEKQDTVHWVQKESEHSVLGDEIMASSVRIEGVAEETGWEVFTMRRYWWNAYDFRGDGK
jgi:hypothetical protein